MAMMSCPITACPFQVHRCYPRVNSSSSWEPCNWLGSHFSLTDEKMQGSEMVDVVWTLLCSSFFSVCVYVVCVVVVFEKEPRASYMVSNCSVPEPHPSSRPLAKTSFLIKPSVFTGVCYAIHVLEGRQKSRMWGMEMPQQCSDSTPVSMSD